MLSASLALATVLGPAFAAEALPLPVNCQVDPRGANDRPGQRDVTMFCVDRGNGAPWELHAALSFDETTVRGSNTMDSCALFNTDGDAFANLAVCVTLDGGGGDNLTRLQSVRLFTCDNRKADKCMGPVPVPGPYTTSCEVTHPDTDPFSPAAEGGPGDDYPYDTQVVCAIDLDDFGVSPPDPRMLDACSFPSSVPNSDAEDCILYSDCVADVACDDGNDCTVDVCDSSGVCMHLADAAAACTDGLFCTGAEYCNSLGFCESAGVPVSCDDGVECTIDDCDEMHDRCVNDPRNSICDDGLYCTGLESCDPESGCTSGEPPDCSDSVSCTVDSCDESSGSCTHVPSDAACEDGSWCNGSETCDADAGCLAGAAPDCSDGIACTLDSCDEAADACRYAAVDGSCSDDLFCNGQEVCDPQLGCRPGEAPDCDDNVGCTADACSEMADVCVNTPENSACDDGEYCNGVELCDPVADCQVGTEPCLGPAICSESTDTCVGCLGDAECDNGVYCDGAETCDAETATCEPGEPVRCDDGVACTLDSCNESAGACEHEPNAAMCDNGRFCDGEETCNPLLGCVAGPTAACDDGIACTVDSCNEAADRCSHKADDAVCDNGRFCDGEEVCNTSSGCEEGEPPTCRPDRFECTIEECDDSANACVSDYAYCVCGDREITLLEECEPPARAGTFEDCNNGVDDDGDGDIDCTDVDCEAGSPRGIVCDENCNLDRLCAPVSKDPALIRFHRRSGPDSFWMHGRFPIDGTPDPLAEGIQIEISNGVQPIYVATLGAGDLTAVKGKRFRFRDKDARHLGSSSARNGLGMVSLLLKSIRGEPYISFRVRAYGDFSSATHRVMSSQITIGGEVGSLTEEWTAKPRRWILRQRDF